MLLVHRRRGQLREYRLLTFAGFYILQDHSSDATEHEESDDGERPSGTLLEPARFRDLRALGEWIKMKRELEARKAVGGDVETEEE